jgi:hypothetical protein
LLFRHARPEKLSITQTSRARGGVPWRASDTHVSPRARIAQRPLELPTGKTVRPPATLDCSPTLNRAKRYAARHGSQSAYKAIAECGLRIAD